MFIAPIGWGGFEIKNMAQYKVPQDVEADDKLVGPFGFRQFGYIVISFLLGGAAYSICAAIGFENMLSWLVILLFLPPCGFLILLAIPRKDQPMETYIAALIKFYFKPHLRVWDADGIQTMIEISVPVVDDAPKTKEFDGAEAARRMSFFAEIADNGGQSTSAVANKNLNEEFVASTADATDILSQTDSLGQELENKLLESEQKTRQGALEWMKYNKDHSPIETEGEVAPQPAPAPAPEPQPEPAPESSMQSFFGSTAPEETPAPMPQPAPEPEPAPQPEPIPAPVPEPEIPAPAPPVEPVPIEPIIEKTEKPAIIEDANVKSAHEPAGVEEIIGHDGEEDSEEVEIELH